MVAMKSKRYFRYSFGLIFFIGACGITQAQDTSKRKTIDITSTYKPVLRDAVKLNFPAALPKLDTSRPLLNYDIPRQQVRVPYQPGTLKPIALETDSMLAWNDNQYLKIGAGNYHLPYLQGAASFGDGSRAFMSAYAEYYSSKGKLPFQKNNLGDFQLRGSYKVSDNHELSGKLGFKGEDYFLYGYQPTTLEFSKSDLKQRFQTVDGYIGFRNTNPTTYGISYSPTLTFDAFAGKNDGNKSTENNFVFNLPLQKTFGKMFGFNLGFMADLTRYKPESGDDIKNNLITVSPALLLKTPNVYIHTGILPSWDNKEFTMLPNIMAELTTNDQRFTLQGGWIGYFNKGSYQRFAGINPWIAPPDELLNHRIREAYVGFKGNLASGFTFNAKAAYSEQKNVNLFVNDQVDGKTFLTVYSPSMEVLQLHGELGYLRGEEFSFTTGLTYNNFTKIGGQTRAWGLIPLEVKAALRWKVLKDLSFKADLFAWDGPAYRTKEGNARKGDKAFDLNAGLDFRVSKKLNLWLQTNNIFNNNYQRWNQYEVFGFNLLGGVIFRFGQN